MQKTNPFYLLGIVTLLLLSFLLFGIKRAAAGHDPSQPAAANHPSTIPLKVDRLDPSIDAIIPANAVLERVATGFTWVEGPVW
ncbi:MAG: hypothetical protein WBC92_05815, partial [Terracidiphilus sp.]